MTEYYVPAGFVLRQTRGRPREFQSLFDQGAPFDDNGTYLSLSAELFDTPGIIDGAEFLQLLVLLCQQHSWRVNLLRQVSTFNF